MQTVTQTAIREFYETYLACRRYLFDVDVDTKYSFVFEGTLSEEMTLLQTFEKANSYYQGGSLLTTLQGADTEVPLQRMFLKGMREFLKALIRNWNSQSDAWRGRNIQTSNIVLGVAITDVNVLDNSTTYPDVSSLLAIRNSYRDAWGTLIARIQTAVRDRQRQYAQLFQFITEPRGTNVTIEGTNYSAMGATAFPFVQTLPPVPIRNGYTCGGNIVSDGGISITERGIVYGTVSSVTIESGGVKTVVSGTGLGNFSVDVRTSQSASFTPGTEYWIRAYAMYSGGVQYGNAVSFKAFTEAEYESAPSLTIYDVVRNGTTTVRIPETSLYPFNSWTFTSCGASRATGPTLSQCRTSYSNASWRNNTNLFNVVSGIQQWKVPVGGTYIIEARGGQGGSFMPNPNPNFTNKRGGYGARHAARVTLSKDTLLNIVVGQNGFSGAWSTGGGGASYVYSGTTLHMIAGGGGGAGYTADGADSLSTNGTIGTFFTPPQTIAWSNGSTRCHNSTEQTAGSNDGTSCTYNNSTYGSGGKGWTSLQTSPGQNGTGTTYTGGFGGGGSANSEHGAGGGAGYRGGAAGNFWSNTAGSALGTGSAGAGGSWPAPIPDFQYTISDTDYQAKVIIRLESVNQTEETVNSFDVTIGAPVFKTNDSNTSNGSHVKSVGAIWSQDAVSNLTVALPTKATTVGRSMGRLKLAQIGTGVIYNLRAFATTVNDSVIYGGTAMPTLQLSAPVISGTATLTAATTPNVDASKQDYTFSGVTITSVIPHEYTGSRPIAVVYMIAASQPADTALRLGAAGVLSVLASSVPDSSTNSLNLDGITITVDKVCSAQNIYARAYAKNAVGESYGSIIMQAITLLPTSTPSITNAGSFSVISDTHIRLSGLTIRNSASIKEYGIIWWIDNRSVTARSLADADVSSFNIVGKPANDSTAVSVDFSPAVSWPSSGAGSLAQLIRVRVYIYTHCSQTPIYSNVLSLKFYKYSTSPVVTLWPGGTTLIRHGSRGINELSTAIFGDSSVENYPSYPSYERFIPGLTTTSTIREVAGDSFFSISLGIQQWIIPRDGIYKIEAWGGTPLWTTRGQTTLPKQVGYVVGHFNLRQNASVSVLVGQAGSSSVDGGGSTTVYFGNITDIASVRITPSILTPLRSVDHHLLMMAGGTAGYIENSGFMTDTDTDKSQCPITLETSANPSITAGRTISGGGGGAGLTVDGTIAYGLNAAWASNTPPRSVLRGGEGGASGGGFGGGGGRPPSPIIGGGGGGGLSGGDGGNRTSKARGGTSFLNVSSPLFNNSRDYSNKPGGTAYELVRPVGSDANAGRSMVKITWVSTVP